MNLSLLSIYSSILDLKTNSNPFQILTLGIKIKGEFLFGLLFFIPI